MLFTSWLRRLRSALGQPAKSRSARRKPRAAVPPFLEWLEDRTVLSVFTEFPVPTPNSGPFDMTLGSDGNVWFTEVDGGNKIGRITPAGTITEFTLPTANAEPFGIGLGPDGNVWFGETNTFQIGRITPSGVITEFPGLTGQYQGVAAGPAGTVWVTENTSNQIALVSTSGAILSQFTVPTPNADIGGPASSPDGTLWFDETSANKIGRLTPNGTFTEFTIPTPNSWPSGTVVDAAGNVWFTESIANKIGRLTPAGVFTEFPVPTPNSGAPFSGPEQLTVAPDGNIWFIEQSANQIARITPAGVVTEFPIPTPNSDPVAIAATADGHIWFSERTADQIGRFVWKFLANAGDPYTISYGQALKLDASASADPDGDSLTYAWTINGEANAAIGVNPTLNCSQLATLGITGPGTFTVSVTASDGNGEVVTSAPVTLTVTPDGTTTALSSSPNPSVYGQTVIFTANVSVNAPGSGTPTGSVDFVDTTTGQDLGSKPLSNGSASLSTALLTAGNHRITATYSGDGDFNSSDARLIQVGGFTEVPVPTPGSFPTGIIVGPDGNVWFGERDADKIGYITPAGAITEYSVNVSNTRMWGITAGPDGNLWFALEGDGVPSEVGRITPAGAMTLFPILPAYSYPDVTTGPDGNLWVTEGNNNQIAVVSPQGLRLNQFNIPVPGGIPEFITVGPDGNLWFTETVATSEQTYNGPVGAGYVGRVSPDGNFTMFAIPEPINTLKGIATGADGSIWFVEQYASVNKIGRLTTSGALTEFAIPTPNSIPSALRLGPDGNLWFTEYGANQIASITPNGVITEYPIPTPNSGLADIVTGPDGNLWFTESNANQIGRFNLSPGQKVNPAALTVVTNSNLMLVGNNPPPLTGSVNGTPFTGSITYTTVYGDHVTITLSIAGSTSAVGQYAIIATLSGASAGNYVVNPATSTIGTMYVVSIGADPTSTTGAQAVTFWDNKGNAKLITAADLSSLDTLNLVKQGGADFDPKAVAQLQAWLSTSPNATTAYQLAVQLAAMDLNVLAGYVKGTDLVYAGALQQYGISGLDSGGFISVQNLMSAANAVLSQVSPGNPSSDSNQAYEAALAQVLQAANGNSNFVQQEALWNLFGL